MARRAGSARKRRLQLLPSTTTPLVSSPTTASRRTLPWSIRISALRALHLGPPNRPSRGITAASGWIETKFGALPWVCPSSWRRCQRRRRLRLKKPPAPRRRRRMTKPEVEARRHSAEAAVGSTPLRRKFTTDTQTEPRRFRRRRRPPRSRMGRLPPAQPASRPRRLRMAPQSGDGPRRRRRVRRPRCRLQRSARSLKASEDFRHGFSHYRAVRRGTGPPRQTRHSPSRAGQPTPTRRRVCRGLST